MTDKIDLTSMLTSLEQELHESIQSWDEPGFEEYIGMMAYHLGWEGEGSGPDAQVKESGPSLCYSPVQLQVEYGARLYPQPRR